VRAYYCSNLSTRRQRTEPDRAPAGAPANAYKTIAETLAELHGPLRDLYEELRASLVALGDDVQEKTLKYYVAFKRIKNFSCVEVHPGKGVLTAYVKVNPKRVLLEKGFTRDVSKIGHFGTGDLEITLRNRSDLEKAKGLFQDSYEAS
jgi:predicted transport protein